MVCRFGKRSFLVIVTGALLLTSDVLAVQFRGALQQLHDNSLTATTRRISKNFFNRSEFGLNDTWRSRSLSDPRLDWQQKVERFLRDQPFSLSSYPSVLQLKERRSGFEAVQDGRVRKEFQFLVNGIELCGYYGITVVTSQNSLDDDAFLAGTYPEVFDSPSHSSSTWGDWRPVWRQLKEDYSVGELSLIGRQKCYFPSNNVFIPAWSFVYRVAGVKLRSFADENSVLATEQLSFDASTASIYAFDRNSSESDLVEFVIDGMSANGFLENDRFSTYSTSDKQARSTTGVFEFETDSPEFAQASIFAHVNRFTEWMETIGFERYVGAKINLVHSPSFNQAVYEPADETIEEPMIIVGDGDGVHLDNVATDSDVVSHEFGHHVIYRTLKSAKGESGVLHEGIADYLAHTASGNSCLGESICPPGSVICKVAEQCLRDADNELRFDSPTLPYSIHERSQLISGMLWDVQKLTDLDQIDMTTNEWHRLVVRSLFYLHIESGYYDFVVSLLHADEDFFGGSHCEVILESVRNRGFKTIASKLSCGGELPVAPAKAPPAAASSSSGSSGSFCGVVHSSVGDERSNRELFLFYVLLIVPFLFATFHRRLHR